MSKRKKRGRGLMAPSQYVMGVRRSFLLDGAIAGGAVAAGLYFVSPNSWDNKPPLWAGVATFVVVAFGQAILNEEW